MLRRLLLAWGALVTGLVVSFPLITGLVFGGFGTDKLKDGTTGVWLAGLLAAGICLLTGVLALGITALRPRDARGVSFILGAMLVRMLLPLAALALLTRTFDELGLIKFSLQLLPYYLIMLAIETLLSLWIGSAENAAVVDAAVADAAVVDAAVVDAGSGKGASHGR